MQHNSLKHAQQFVFFWYLHTSRLTAFCPISDQLSPLSLWWALTKKGQFLGSHRQGRSKYHWCSYRRVWYFLNNHTQPPSSLTTQVWCFADPLGFVKSHPWTVIKNLMLPLVCWIHTGGAFNNFDMHHKQSGIIILTHGIKTWLGWEGP